MFPTDYGDFENFRAAVAADPADLLGHQAFADFLEETGHPEAPFRRAAFDSLSRRFSAPAGPPPTTRPPGGHWDRLVQPNPRGPLDPFVQPVFDRYRGGPPTALHPYLPGGYAWRWWREPGDPSGPEVAPEDPYDLEDGPGSWSDLRRNGPFPGRPDEEYIPDQNRLFPAELWFAGISPPDSLNPGLWAQVEALMRARHARGLRLEEDEAPAMYGAPPRPTAPPGSGLENPLSSRTPDRRDDERAPLGTRRPGFQPPAGLRGWLGNRPRNPEDADPEYTAENSPGPSIVQRALAAARRYLPDRDFDFDADLRQQHVRRAEAHPGGPEGYIRDRIADGEDPRQLAHEMGLGEADVQALMNQPAPQSDSADSADPDDEEREAVAFFGSIDPNKVRRLIHFLQDSDDDAYIAEKVGLDPELVSEARRLTPAAAREEVRRLRAQDAAKGAKGTYTVVGIGVNGEETQIEVRADDEESAQEAALAQGVFITEAPVPSAGPAGSNPSGGFLARARRWMGLPDDVPADDEEREAAAFDEEREEADVQAVMNQPAPQSDSADPDARAPMSDDDFYGGLLQTGLPAAGPMWDEARARLGMTPQPAFWGPAAAGGPIAPQSTQAAPNPAAGPFTAGFPRQGIGPNPAPPQAPQNSSPGGENDGGDPAGDEIQPGYGPDAARPPVRGRGADDFTGRSGALPGGTWFQPGAGEPVTPSRSAEPNWSGRWNAMRPPRPEESYARYARYDRFDYGPDDATRPQLPGARPRSAEEVAARPGGEPYRWPVPDMAGPRLGAPDLNGYLQALGILTAPRPGYALDEAPTGYNLEEQRAFEGRLDADGFDQTLRHAYADWLRERGDWREGAFNHLMGDAAAAGRFIGGMEDPDTRDALEDLARLGADWDINQHRPVGYGQTDYGDAEDEAAFRATIAESPWEQTGHLALADWYADRGRPDDEAFRRGLWDVLAARLSGGAPPGGPRVWPDSGVMRDPPRGFTEIPEEAVRTADRTGQTLRPHLTANGDWDWHPWATEMRTEGFPDRPDYRDWWAERGRANQVPWPRAGRLSPAELGAYDVDRPEDVDPRIWPQIEALMQRHWNRPAYHAPGVRGPARRFEDPAAPVGYGEADDEAGFLGALAGNPWDVTGHLALSDWYGDRGREADQRFRADLADVLRTRLDTPYPDDDRMERSGNNWMLHAAPRGFSPGNIPAHTVAVNDPGNVNPGWGTHEMRPSMVGGVPGAWDWQGRGRTWMGPGAVPPDSPYPEWQGWLQARGYVPGAGPESARQARLLTPAEHGAFDLNTPEHVAALAAQDPALWPQVEALLRGNWDRFQQFADDEAPTEYAREFDREYGRAPVEELFEGRNDDPAWADPHAPTGYGDRETLQSRLAETPWDTGLHGALADWEQEFGAPEDAAFRAQSHEFLKERLAGMPDTIADRHGWLHGPRRFDQPWTRPTASLRGRETGMPQLRTFMPHQDSVGPNFWAVRPNPMLRPAFDEQVAEHLGVEPDEVRGRALNDLWKRRPALEQSNTAFRDLTDAENLYLTGMLDPNLDPALWPQLEAILRERFDRGERFEDEEEPAMYGAAEDEAAFIRSINDSPFEQTPHLAMADWLRDRDRHADADFRSAVPAWQAGRMGQPSGWKLNGFLDQGDRRGDDRYQVRTSRAVGTGPNGRFGTENTFEPFIWNPDMWPSPAAGGSNIPWWRETGVPNRIEGAGFDELESEYPDNMEFWNARRGLVPGGDSDRLTDAERALTGIDDLSAIDPRLWPQIEALLRGRFDRGQRLEGDEEPLEYADGEFPVDYADLPPRLVAGIPITSRSRPRVNPFGPPRRYEAESGPTFYGLDDHLRVAQETAARNPLDWQNHLVWGDMLEDAGDAAEAGFRRSVGESVQRRLAAPSFQLGQNDDVNGWLLPPDGIPRFDFPTAGRVIGGVSSAVFAPRVTEGEDWGDQPQWTWRIAPESHSPFAGRTPADAAARFYPPDHPNFAALTADMLNSDARWGTPLNPAEQWVAGIAPQDAAPEGLWAQVEQIMRRQRMRGRPYGRAGDEPLDYDDPASPERLLQNPLDTHRLRVGADWAQEQSGREDDPEARFRREAAEWLDAKLSTPWSEPRSSGLDGMPGAFLVQPEGREYTWPSLSGSGQLGELAPRRAGEGAPWYWGTDPATRRPLARATSGVRRQLGIGPDADVSHALALRRGWHSGRHLVNLSPLDERYAGITPFGDMSPEEYAQVLALMRQRHGALGRFADDERPSMYADSAGTVPNGFASREEFAAEVARLTGMRVGPARIAQILGTSPDTVMNITKKLPPDQRLPAGFKPQTVPAGFEDRGDFEREVQNLARFGMTNREIAAHLGTTLPLVKAIAGGVPTQERPGWGRSRIEGSGYRNPAQQEVEQTTGEYILPFDIPAGDLRGHYPRQMQDPEKRGQWDRLREMQQSGYTLDEMAEMEGFTGATARRKLQGLLGQDPPTATDLRREIHEQEGVPILPIQAASSHLAWDESPTSYSDEAFQGAIRDNPDDDLSWGVYADWLEEQGRTQPAGRARWWGQVRGRLGTPEFDRERAAAYPPWLRRLVEVGWQRGQLQPPDADTGAALRAAHHAAQLHSMGLLDDAGLAAAEAEAERLHTAHHANPEPTDDEGLAHTVLHDAINSVRGDLGRHSGGWNLALPKDVEAEFPTPNARYGRTGYTSARPEPRPDYPDDAGLHDLMAAFAADPDAPAGWTFFDWLDHHYPNDGAPAQNYACGLPHARERRPTQYPPVSAFRDPLEYGDRETLEAEIAGRPWDSLGHAMLSDWHGEHGDPQEAAFRQAVSGWLPTRVGQGPPDLEVGDGGFIQRPDWSKWAAPELSVGPRGLDGLRTVAPAARVGASRTNPFWKILAGPLHSSDFNGPEEWASFAGPHLGLDFSDRGLVHDDAAMSALLAAHPQWGWGRRRSNMLNPAEDLYLQGAISEQTDPRLWPQIEAILREQQRRGARFADDREPAMYGDRETLESEIAGRPWDALGHAMLSDWHGEHGDPQEAAFRQAVAKWLPERMAAPPTTVNRFTGNPDARFYAPWNPDSPAEWKVLRADDGISTLRPWLDWAERDVWRVSPTGRSLADHSGGIDAAMTAEFGIPDWRDRPMRDPIWAETDLRGNGGRVLTPAERAWVGLDALNEETDPGLWPQIEAILRRQRRTGMPFADDGAPTAYEDGWQGGSGFGGGDGSHEASRAAPDRDYWTQKDGTAGMTEYGDLENFRAAVDSDPQNLVAQQAFADFLQEAGHDDADFQRAVFDSLSRRGGSAWSPPTTDRFGFLHQSGITGPEDDYEDRFRGDPWANVWGGPDVQSTSLFTLRPALSGEHDSEHLIENGLLPEGTWAWDVTDHSPTQNPADPEFLRIPTHSQWGRDRLGGRVPGVPPSNARHPNEMAPAERWFAGIDAPSTLDPTLWQQVRALMEERFNGGQRLADDERPTPYEDGWQGGSGFGGGDGSHEVSRAAPDRDYWTQKDGLTEYNLQDQRAFEEALNQNPLDATTHGVYADWLRERELPRMARTHDRMRDWVVGPPRYTTGMSPVAQRDTLEDAFDYARPTEYGLEDDLRNMAGQLNSPEHARTRWGLPGGDANLRGVAADALQEFLGETNPDWAEPAAGLLRDPRRHVILRPGDRGWAFPGRPTIGPAHNSFWGLNHHVFEHLGGAVPEVFLMDEATRLDNLIDPELADSPDYQNPVERHNVRVVDPHPSNLAPSGRVFPGPDMFIPDLPGWLARFHDNNRNRWSATWDDQPEEAYWHILEQLRNSPTDEDDPAGWGGEAPYADQQNPVGYGLEDDIAAFHRAIRQSPLEVTNHGALADMLEDNDHPEAPFRRAVHGAVGRRHETPWAAPAVDTAGWMLPGAPHGVPPQDSGLPDLPWLRTMSSPTAGGERNINRFYPAVSNGDWDLNDYPEGTWAWGGGYAHGRHVPIIGEPELSAANLRAMLGAGPNEDLAEWEHSRWQQSRIDANPTGDYRDGEILQPAERLWAGIDDWQNMNPEHWPALEAILRREHGRGARLENDGAPAMYGPAEDEAAFIRSINEQPLETTNHLVMADWLQDQGRDADANFRRDLAGVLGTRLSSPFGSSSGAPWHQALPRNSWAPTPRGFTRPASVRLWDDVIDHSADGVDAWNMLPQLTGGAGDQYPWEWQRATGSMLTSLDPEGETPAERAERISAMLGDRRRGEPVEARHDNAWLDARRARHSRPGGVLGLRPSEQFAFDLRDISEEMPVTTLWSDIERHLREQHERNGGHFARGDSPIGYSRLTPPNRRAYLRTPTEYAMPTSYADTHTIDALTRQLAAAEMNPHRWGHDDPLGGLRGVLADALDEAGRGHEAAILRSPGRHVVVRPDGTIGPGRSRVQFGNADAGVLQQLFNFDFGDGMGWESHTGRELVPVYPGDQMTDFCPEDFGEGWDFTAPVAPGHVRFVETTEGDYYTFDDVPEWDARDYVINRISGAFEDFIDSHEFPEDAEDEFAEIDRQIGELRTLPFEEEDPELPPA